MIKRIAGSRVAKLLAPHNHHTAPATTFSWKK